MEDRQFPAMYTGQSLLDCYMHGDSRKKPLLLRFLFRKPSAAYAHLTELKKELAMFRFYHPKIANTHR